MKDTQGILDKPGENTQAARLIRFTHVHDILDMEPTLKAYIKEAIDVVKAGLKVELKKKPELNYPEELQEKLDDFPEFKTAFEALTQGRQKAYVIFFSQPKQSKTRESRVETYMQQILEGKGLFDKYSMKK